MIITTDGETELPDGYHAITAVQSFGNYPFPVEIGNRSETIDLVSERTVEIGLTVNGDPPKCLSDSAMYEVAYENEDYGYDVETDDEASGNVVYSLTTSPTSMAISL